MAAADYNGSAYVWDVAAYKLTATFKDPDSQGVYDVDFSPHGTYMAAADYNGSA